MPGEGVNRQKRLKTALRLLHSRNMGLPEQPVTLTTEQVAELNKLLSMMRHDINGDLALIVAAAELIKLNPDITPRMLTTLLEQPPKIRDRADKFSSAFEKTLGIARR